MKYIIQQQECGYLLKNGVFQKLLMAGKHIYFGKQYEVKIVPMNGYVDTSNIPLEILKSNEEFSTKTVYTEIPDNCIAIHFVNGSFKDVVIGNEAICWNVYDKNEFKLIDITNPYMEETLPRMYFDLMPSDLYEKITVDEGEVGLLYFDKQFQKELTQGTYYFWNYERKIDCKFFDLKIQSLDVNGQDILTADKVEIRLNVACNYRITNPQKLVQIMDDVYDQLYTLIQLNLREYIGTYRIDELLLQKKEISDWLYQKMKEYEEDYCVEIMNIGIKDIILPGEIRDIMNTVLIAEKQAQANVITRREEVASTRSLLNTAKLMDENKTLFRLKELEYLERICDKVGNISLNGGNVMEQLRELMGSTKTNLKN